MSAVLPTGRSLIIVPGLTGPFSASHHAAYKLLVDRALERNYGEAIPVVLPGQADASGARSGCLSFTAAVAKVRQVVIEEAGLRNHVRICGISFGCGVALAAVADLEAPTLPQRISMRLCGPIPQWQSWNAFWKGPKPEQLGRETVFPDYREFFTNLQPSEILPRECRVPTKVCQGTLDEYSPPAWLDYLKALCSAAQSETCIDVMLPPLAGCHHTVVPAKSPGFAGYLDFMLN